MLLHIWITFYTQTILSYFVNTRSPLPHANARLPQKWVTHLLTSFPQHYLVMTVLFDVMHCELLHALLNKPQMKKKCLFLLFGPLKIGGYFMYRQVEN